MAGFEPTNTGVKVLCLTAWRHPNISQDTEKVRAQIMRLTFPFSYGVDERSRTVGLQSHNLAL